MIALDCRNYEFIMDNRGRLSHTIIMRINRLIQYLLATPQHGSDNLNMRAWFYFYCAMLAAVCGLNVIGSHYYFENGDGGAKVLWELSLYFFYFALANTYVPLPTAFLILLLASPNGGLGFIPPIPRVLMVGLIGSLATGIAHIQEYYFTSYLFRLGKIHKIKETRIYLWAERQFKDWPFMLQVILNFIPIPADPSRWLAIISQYSRKKYFTAQCLGRFLRYSLMGLASEVMSLSVKQIILIQVGLFVLGMITFIIHRLHDINMEKKNRKDPVFHAV